MQPNIKAQDSHCKDKYSDCNVGYFLYEFTVKHKSEKIQPFGKVFENYISHYHYHIAYTTLADNTHHIAMSNWGHRAREE